MGNNSKENYMMHFCLEAHGMTKFEHRNSMHPGFNPIIPSTYTMFAEKDIFLAKFFSLAFNIQNALEEKVNQY
jgi:hypothetical protein